MIGMNRNIPRIPDEPGESQRAEADRVSLAGLMHLLVVYLVWGSTYLAIRFAVREGAGFPPFTMAAMRVFAAGGLLLAWAAITRAHMKLTARDAAVLGASGILLWVGGNGSVVWAEQRADSGYAALLVGSMPIWVVIMEAVLDRRLPSLFLTGSLIVGFAGLGLLTGPVLLHGSRADLIGVAALLFAPISWGAGAILQQRRPVRLSPQVSSGYQHVFGGLGFLACVLIAREPLPSPTAEAWAAWGYLTIAGSVLAFTSFIYALRLLPISITMTYAYVNPVIAMFLGWMILGEAITPWMIAGTVLVLIGVAGAFHDKYGGRPGPG